MTSAGRAAMWLVEASLLAAVALLAAQGALVPFVAAVMPASALALVLRALVRQRAPSICDRPLVPERYRVADDLTQPITVVVEAAEAEAR